MNTPTATYRLQFRNGMTFERAAALAGYLARLGISHLYASPLFAAAPGSTHGYDGIGFDRIEPDIGGEPGFNRLSDDLDRSGLKLLLDFVPNHMAAHDGNRWWRDVLEWGRASPFANIFDIDWSAPKLLLPLLPMPYDAALQGNRFRIAFDRQAGRFALTCDGLSVPLTPPSYAILLARAADRDLAELGICFANASRDQALDLMRRLQALANAAGTARAIADAVVAASGDHGLLGDVHNAQVWRLAHWRLARTRLPYRRFFEIADLICLRVEDPAVFETVHVRLLQMIAAGQVAGVRIDHVDGLADPKSYLERLQRAASMVSPCYLLVEKILEHDERLRPGWPVAGTTGYEFIAALSGLFVDRSRESELSRVYDVFTNSANDYEAAARDSKREIFQHNLAVELTRLTERAKAIAAGTRRTSAVDADVLRRAIVELAAVLPVYRTYVDATGADRLDRALIENAVSEAKAAQNEEVKAAIDFIGWLLLSEKDRVDIGDALAFTKRFQQTTGPVMAKAIEDTLFYRYNRLIALNEVGGAPNRYGAPQAVFHDAMAERLQTQPGGLSATATHDTKRGEDARARLYALSEMPEDWERAVRRWAGLNDRHKAMIDGGPAPEPAMEWLYYQALAGVWPMELIRLDQPGDSDAALDALRARMVAYMEKAAREAQQRTSWTEPNADYEKAMSSFVVSTLSDRTGRVFLHDFVRTCRPIWLAGAVNSLAQLAIKLTAPGVPDIYQGTELWDLSLVDPDNRAPVDFDLRQRLIAEIAQFEPERLLENWKSGVPKMALTAAGLRMRADRPALFSLGSYTPIAATGPCARHVVAFARERHSEFTITVIPRFVRGLMAGADRPIVAPDRWHGTAILPPNRFQRRRVRDLLAGTEFDLGTELHVAKVFARFPVALFRDMG